MNAEEATDYSTHVLNLILDGYSDPDTIDIEEQRYIKWHRYWENEHRHKERELIISLCKVEIERPGSNVDSMMGIDKASYNIGIATILNYLEARDNETQGIGGETTTAGGER